MMVSPRDVPSSEELQPPLGRLVRDVEIGLHDELRPVLHPHHDGGGVLHIVLRLFEGDRFVEGADVRNAHAGDVFHQVDAVYGMSIMQPPPAFALLCRQLPSS
jgi:hypothetical protein